MARSHYGFLWLALLVSCLTFRPLIERYASFIGPDVLLDFTSSSGQLNHIRDQFGHVAPSKLAVPFGDHLTINATRALFKRLRSSVEISDQEWNDLLNKASDLRCMMKLSAELTATLGHAAKMTDHKAEFERRGWRTTRTTHAVIGEGWDVTFNEHGSGDLVWYKSMHNKDWEAEGKRASRGQHVFSAYKAKRRKISGPLPELAHWSDVVFMQYYTAIAIEDVLNIKGLDPNGRSQVPCPKYILIPVIISDSPTKPIIERILSETGKSIEVLENEEYPGVQYDVRTDEKAKAIVASPHGQAVAWFLIQHKDQFGVHEMKTVKMYYELSHWNLWFELGPVEHGAKKRDVPSLHHMNQKRRVDLEGELRPMLAEVV